MGVIRDRRQRGKWCEFQGFLADGFCLFPHVRASICRRERVRIAGKIG